MFRAILLLIIPLTLWANHGQQTSFILDAGVNTFSVTNSGSQGGTVTITDKSFASFTRLGITLVTIYVPPETSTTYTGCADPCTQSVNREWGIVYIFVEDRQSDGSAFSPRRLKGPPSAFEANTCDLPGTLPFIRPATVTTSPMPMPRVVVGLDCFEDTTQRALRNGHAFTNIYAILRTHNDTYNGESVRWDGKVDLAYNNGAWINFNNSNASVTSIDDTQRRYVAPNNGVNLDYTTNPPLNFGGTMQVRERMVAIPDGTIGSGDTTVVQHARSRGTNSVTSGFRILENVLVEGTPYTTTQIACTSNSCVGTTTGGTFSAGESIYIRNAPNSRLRGPQTLTAGGSGTFTFTPSTGSAGALPSYFTIPNGTYTTPVNINTQANPATDQINTIVYKMIEDAANFSYPDGSLLSSPGGNATNGQNLFLCGANTCSGGEHTLVNAGLRQFGFAIQANCIDCHVGAWDLSYFKVDNSAIRMRSMFHGLTFTQGNDIATYIRSLNTSVSPPFSGYLWNPVGQPGPNMDNYSWVAGTTLTSIVVDSSHHAVLTVTTSPTNVRVNDPVYISKATTSNLNTSDTSGSLYHVTSVNVGAKTINFDVNSSLAAGTYNNTTDPGLIVNMTNAVMGGCSVDCVLPFAFEELHTALDFSSPTKFQFDQFLNPLTLPSHWQMMDWMRHMLPTVHPMEFPRADFLNSTPYLNAVNVRTMTPGNFNSFKAKGYSTLRDVQTYVGVDINSGTQNLPASTDAFNFYPDRSAAYSGPLNLNEYRFSVQKLFFEYAFTLATKYGVLAMNAQWRTDVTAAASGSGCYPPVGLMDNGFWFNVLPPHKAKNPQEGMGDRLFSTWQMLTNIGYMQTPALNGGACYDTPDGYIDPGYITPFAYNIDPATPGGYESWWIPNIYAVQGGRQNADLAYHNNNQAGQTWSNIFDLTMSAQKINSYFWLTTARHTELQDTALNQMNAAAAAHTTAYWSNTISHGGTDNAQLSCTAGTYVEGVGNFCRVAASNLAFLRMFGANSTNRATLKTFFAAVMPTHNFDVDETAGAEADSVDVNPSCSGCGTSGSHTITLTFSSGSGGCPNSAANIVFGTGVPPTAPPVTISSSGTTPYELLYPTGGTCAARGGSGTLTFTSLQAYSGTMDVRWGCSTAKPLPNWPADIFGSPRAFRCSDMDFVNPVSP